MSTYSQTIQAGGSWEIGVPGELFRVIVAAKPVNLTFKKNGVPIAQENNVLDGFWAKPAGGFNSVLIESAEAQTVTVGVFTGNAGYDRYSGIVEVANNIDRGPVSIQAKTVNAASGQLVAANGLRKFLLIQNNGASDIFINVDAAATVAGGVRLGPGGSWEFSKFVPSGEVNAVAGSSNSAVIVVEG